MYLVPFATAGRLVTISYYFITGIIRSLATVAIAQRACTIISGLTVEGVSNLTPSVTTSRAFAITVQLFADKEIGASNGGVGRFFDRSAFLALYIEFEPGSLWQHFSKRH